MNELPDVLMAFFIGAAALTGAVSIAARIAFKPILESWIRLRQASAEDDHRLRQERRIEFLEEELRRLSKTTSGLIEAEEFRRQLETSPAKLPRMNAAAQPTKEAGA